MTNAVAPGLYRRQGITKQHADSTVINVSNEVNSTIGVTVI